MTVHLVQEIELLKRRLLAFSGVVEESVQNAVLAVAERDAALARAVIAGDTLVDRGEVEIEEECLKLFALHQPVAIDLRFLVAVIKLNSDLERIGDLAVNIAERAVYLAEHAPVPIPFDFPTMATKTRSMLRQALDSLVRMDAEAALAVCRADDEIDTINRDMYARVTRGIQEHPDHLERLIHILAVSRHLERIADHATNIAEDVLYMIRGEIVRHRGSGQKAD